MLSILSNGVSILYAYKEEIIIFLIGVMGFGSFFINYIPYWEANPRIKLFAAFSVGSAILCVATYILILLSYFLPFLLQPGSYALFLFAVFVLLKEFWAQNFRNIFNYHVLLIGLVLFVLLLLRLAFLKHILLPPYSDSPVHYQIVFGFLHPQATAHSKLSFATIFSDYYHFGFHSLAAWLASITKLDPANSISLLGQLFLIIAPVSASFLAYILTNNGHAAFFTGLLAAAGWDMPAFAINWGKFPAISAVAVLPSVVAFLGLYVSSRRPKNIRLLWGGVLLVGITLMHTRILILILLIATCFYVSKKFLTGTELRFFQSLWYSLLYIVSLWPLWNLLVEFYVRIPILIVLMILLPFAFQVYSRLTFGIFLFTFGLWLIAIVPRYVFPNYQALLDRQFLEIMLYIPFALIGGVGFAAILRQLPSMSVLRWSMMIAFVGIVLFCFVHQGPWYPDPCCDYFKESDQLAFQWIQARASTHSLVLISSFDDHGRIMGTDGGIWLFPWIGQPTNKLPFNFKWDSPDGMKSICQLDAEEIYIYMGGRQFSFDNIQLTTQKWITRVFRSGNTFIYQVMNCPP